MLKDNFKASVEIAVNDQTAFFYNKEYLPKRAIPTQDKLDNFNTNIQAETWCPISQISNIFLENFYMT